MAAWQTGQEFGEDWCSEDVQAVLARIDELESDLECLQQISGDLCDTCGWNGILANEPCAFCEVYALRERNKKLEEVVRAAEVMLGEKDNPYCHADHSNLRMALEALKEGE